jgi:hypothetical protein
MTKHFGDKVAAELRARARDRDIFEEIFRALDSYSARHPRPASGRAPAWAGDGAVVLQERGCVRLLVRKGKIFLHPRSADIEVMPDVEAAVDRMAVLLAHAILDHGDDIETGEVESAPAMVSQVVKLADGRRS